YGSGGGSVRMGAGYDGRRFGRWVRERRKALDMTQRELAGEIGCSESTLRKFEAGTRRPSRQIVERLASLFGAPSEEQQRVMGWARFGAGHERERGAAEQELETPPRPEDAYVASPRSEAGTSVPPASNLPARLTSLIGRGRELAEVQGYLSSSEVRLLTLT